MQVLIRQLWRGTGVTLVFVTHNTQEALQLELESSCWPGKRRTRFACCPGPRRSDSCAADEFSRLVARLDSAAGSTREPEELTPTIGGATPHDLAAARIFCRMRFSFRC